MNDVLKDVLDWMKKGVELASKYNFTPDYVGWLAQSSVEIAQAAKGENYRATSAKGETK